MKEHEQIVFLEAVSYMEHHMGEAVRVADIAGAIHVSESRLQRSFHACAGTSVHEYLLSIKLRRAMEELQKGQRIGNVAEICGFANRNHFSYCFKKEFGINPSQVKKKLEMP